MTLKGGIGFLMLYVYVQFLVCPLNTVIAVLSGYVNPFAVTKNICDIMGVKFKVSKNASKLHPNAMFLCNHRSWGDFFTDQVICNGAAYLSRYMVAVGCPMSSLYGWIAHSIVFFHRKKGIDRDELAKNLSSKWLARPDHGLIVYPEGTRNQTNAPLKIRTGVLKMAYDYNKPVQSVVTTNKELIANEKTFRIQRNVECVSSISPVIFPKDFKDFDSFVDAVKEQFHGTWDDAYDPKNEAKTYEMPFGLSRPTFGTVPDPKRLWVLRFLLIILIAWVMRAK